MFEGPPFRLVLLARFEIAAFERQFRYEVRQDSTRAQSYFAPDSLTTAAHLSISVLMKLSNSSGVEPTGSM